MSQIIDTPLLIKNRHNQRLEAMNMLYNVDVLKKTIENLNLERLKENSGTLTYDLVTGVLNNLSMIDTIISTCITDYTIDRLSYVDRAIIRVATFEMLEGVAPQIAIDEALKLTKTYTDQGDRKATAFNNKLLDRINAHLKKEER